MRIVALLGGRVGGPIHINREKTEISQVFMEILGCKGGSKFSRSKGQCPGEVNLITVKFLGNDC